MPTTLTVDVSGVWIRPEGEFFITGTTPPEEEDIANPELNVDYSQFDETVWPTIAHRYPALEAVKLVRAWAGHYDYNTLDQNAIIGPHPEIGNFYFANGFSGHGIQQSPGAGRAVAELITHGRFISLDLSVFSFERVADGRPVVEQAVI